MPGGDGSRDAGGPRVATRLARGPSPRSLPSPGAQPVHPREPRLRQLGAALQPLAGQPRDRRAPALAHGRLEGLPHLRGRLCGAAGRPHLPPRRRASGAPEPFHPPPPPRAGGRPGGGPRGRRVLAAARGGGRAAMILGHWYLVTPRLWEGPLIRAARALTAVVVLQI